MLERGELSLAFADGQLVVRYLDYELPVNPKLAPQVLRRAVAPLTAELGADSPQLHEFLSILASLQNLPDLSDGEQPAGTLAAEERQREGSGPGAAGEARRRLSGDRDARRRGRA